MAYSDNDLIKYQQLYEQEKQRLEAQKSSLEAARIKESYDKKVQAAKDTVSLEKLKNEELLALQKHSNKLYLNALKEMANQEKEILKVLKAEVSQIYLDIADLADSNIKSVIKSKEALEEKLSSYGTNLFTHHTVYGGGSEGQDLSFYLLKDFAQTNRDLEEYYKNISSVKNRIASEGFGADIASEFLSVMADMSIADGSTFSKLLLNADSGKLKEYISGYLQNKDLSAKISSSLYSDQFTTAVNETMAYMKSELERIGFEVPEDFSLSGTISAENFGFAFAKELENQLEDIRAMISSFNADLSLSPNLSKSSDGSDNTKNITYNQNFNVGTSKDSTFEQISAWNSAMERSRLRGGIKFV